MVDRDTLLNALHDVAKQYTPHTSDYLIQRFADRIQQEIAKATPAPSQDRVQSFLQQLANGEIGAGRARVHARELLEQGGKPDHIGGANDMIQATESTVVDEDKLVEDIAADICDTVSALNGMAYTPYQWMGTARKALRHFKYYAKAELPVNAGESGQPGSGRSTPQLSSVSNPQVNLQSAPVASPAPATTHQPDESFPMGAIENGRVFIERLNNNYRFVNDTYKYGHHADWDELCRCFEYMADYLLRKPERESRNLSTNDRVEAICDIAASLVQSRPEPPTPYELAADAVKALLNRFELRRKSPEEKP